MIGLELQTWTNFYAQFKLFLWHIHKSTKMTKFQICPATLRLPVSYTIFSYFQGKPSKQPKMVKLGKCFQLAKESRG